MGGAMDFAGNGKATQSRCECRWYPDCYSVLLFAGARVFAYAKVLVISTTSAAMASGGV